MTPRPPYTIVPAEPGCWLIEFSEGDTEAFVLKHSQMVAAWRVDRSGCAWPVVPLTDAFDGWLEGMAILLPDGRVRSGIYTFGSTSEWLKIMQSMRTTGDSFIKCLGLAHLKNELS